MKYIYIKNRIYIYNKMSTTSKVIYDLISKNMSTVSKRSWDYETILKEIVFSSYASQHSCSNSGQYAVSIAFFTMAFTR